MARIFLDSGVFMEEITCPWGAAKGILILGTHRVLSVETSEVVFVEVANALRRKGIPSGPGSEVARLVRELRLTIHPRPSDEAVRAGIQKYLPLMRHRADVPVLVGAVGAQPDWLVFANPKHFNSEVARATGLRIVTLEQLMRSIGLTDVPRRP